MITERQKSGGRRQAAGRAPRVVPSAVCRLHAQRRGAALVMVITVLAILLVLAVSFTFLMSQQQGTSVASLGGEQTRIITRTGADHAFARLNYRNRLNEFARWNAMQQSDVTDEHDPFIDTYDEAVVDLLVDLEQAGVFPGLIDQDGNPLFRVEDPKSRVLGMNVQDESGKVNLNFCNVNTIANLIGSSTVTQNVSYSGGYDQIRLEDASFLDAYDDQGGGNIGGGYVVIDNQLFSYQYRRGNVLFSCMPNPVYNGAGMVNSLFMWRPDGREIQAGEFVTTPTAYKIAWYAWLHSQDGATPALFNSMGDVRRIAEGQRWFQADFARAPQGFDGWPEGLDPVTYQWLEENTTVVAPTEHYDGGWSYPHVLVSGDMVTEGAKSFLQVRYDDQLGVQQDYYVPNDPRRITNIQNNQAFWSGLGVGTLVRLRRVDLPGQVILGAVLQAVPGRPGGLNQPSQYGILNIAVRGSHTITTNETWVIEVAERASININTANLDTIAAVFHGVGPRNQGTGVITRRNAYQIADRILSRVRGTPQLPPEPIVDLNDLLGLLRDMSQDLPPLITAEQITSFDNQQRYPYATRNNWGANYGTVTSQFRYHSLDAWMVDAFATRYQPSGGVLARDAFREWVQVGSDSEQTWEWYNYDQLESEMRIAQGNIFQLHRAGNVNGRDTGLLELPMLHYLADERLVRGWRGAFGLNSPQQPWPGPLARNVWQIADDTVRPEKFYTNVITATPTPAISYEAGNLEAGMFSFWYRPLWTDHNADHYLFDVAEQEYSNRVSMLWWGARRGAYRLSGQNSGLVLRIKDRTLQEAYTELRFELDPAHFRQRDWYHMCLNWKGTELSHISLLLDGDGSSTSGGTAIKPVVNHTFRQLNGSWLTLTTDLTADLENPLLSGQVTFDLPIHNLDIDGFPAQGVLVIGSEAIEYNGNNGFALQNLQRGARGTIATFHPRGSKITVFGYRDGIRAYDNSGSINNGGTINPQHDRQFVPRFPLLPETQGLLNSNLGARAFARVSKQGSNQNGYYRPTELGPDAGFPGAADVARGGDPNHLPLDSYAGIPERGIVAVLGLAWQDYHPAGQTGGIPAGEQYPAWNDDGDANTPVPINGQYPVPHWVLDPRGFFTNPTPPPPTVPVPRPDLNPPVTTPQIGPQLVLGNLKMEYVAYDGVDSAGLRVVARYDHYFNRKPANTWWHFLGTYSGLITPQTPAGQPGYQQEVNIINFLALGSVVMPLSVDVDSVLGYHDRSIVQVDQEWFFYNRLWNPTNGQDPAGTTATGNDDNLFPSLNYIDFERLSVFARYCIVNDLPNQAPFSPWRGAMTTGVTGHLAAARVTPTFGTTIITGEEDIVTVVNGQNQNKEQRQIRRHRVLTDMQADWVSFNNQFLSDPLNTPSAGQWNQYICAFDDHVGFDFMPNPNNTWNTAGNLCKFPTGELPVELPTSWTFAGADPRTIDGGSAASGLTHTCELDAFEFRMYQKGNFRLVSTMTDTLPANAQDVQVNTQLPPNMGVVKIDNELVAYRGTEVRQVTDPITGQTIFQFWLLDITRGILGTTVEAHASGTPIMNMASLRVGRPNQSGTMDEHLIVTTLGEETFRPYGFARIEEEDGTTEIMGYQRYQELLVDDPNNPGVQIRTGNMVCGVFNNPNDIQALFRGSYGTRAMNYSTRALFFDQPVRYPDWFPGYHAEVSRGNTTLNQAPFHNNELEGIPGAASPEISHFQGSATFRNSIFTNFKWRIQYAPEADMGRHDNAIGARLVMRFKQHGQPMPEWDSMPTNRPGGLYSFDFDHNANKTEDLGSTLYEQTEDFTQLPGNEYGIRAERIEWRVYFYFKRDAFTNEDYKTTLQFQGASVTLNQLTRVVRHEEKR